MIPSKEFYSFNRLDLKRVIDEIIINKRFVYEDEEGVAKEHYAVFANLDWTPAYIKVDGTILCELNFDGMIEECKFGAERNFYTLEFAFYATKVHPEFKRLMPRKGLLEVPCPFCSGEAREFASWVKYRSCTACYGTGWVPAKLRTKLLSALASMIDAVNTLRLQNSPQKLTINRDMTQKQSMKIINEFDCTNMDGGGYSFFFRDEIRSIKKDYYFPVR